MMKDLKVRFARDREIPMIGGSLWCKEAVHMVWCDGFRNDEATLIDQLRDAITASTVVNSYQLRDTITVSTVVNSC